MIYPRLQFLNLLFIILVALIFGVRYEYIQTTKEYKANLQLSTEMTDSLTSSNQKKIDTSQLSEIRKSLEASPRKTDLSFIISSLNKRNFSNARERTQHFLEEEKKYTLYLSDQIRIHEAKTDRLFYVLGGLILIFLFLFLNTLRVKIFTPIKSLSKRMTDFLNDRYSYQFKTPDPTEVGSLQSTFNAMAQRVLSNIEELKSLDKAKTEFLNIASHELRTPLTSIKGSLSLLQSGIMGDVNVQSKKLLSIAETETDRLVRLINDLLDLTKIESQKLSLTAKWYNFQEFIERIFLSLEGISKNAKVELNYLSTEDFEVFADSDRIQQVITNLLSNALKYSPEDSKIIVSTSILKGSLRIEILDSGPGIPPEDQNKIFEKFSQSVGPENPLVKGTGLGLAIAKALVEQHHGEIGVSSLPGEGCCFYFSLPEWRVVDIKKDVA